MVATVGQTGFLPAGPGGPRHWPARRGAIVVIAIACTALAAMVMVSLARLAVAQRGRTRTELFRLQSCWLAESALERAAWRLASDPSYAGETWNIPAEALGTTDPAAVTIQVEPLASQPAGRLVRVQAHYPDHPQHRVRQTRQAVIRVVISGEKK